MASAQCRTGCSCSAHASACPAHTPSFARFHDHRPTSLRLKVVNSVASVAWRGQQPRVCVSVGGVCTYRRCPGRPKVDRTHPLVVLRVCWRGAARGDGGSLGLGLLLLLRRWLDALLLRHSRGCCVGWVAGGWVAGLSLVRRPRAASLLLPADSSHRTSATARGSLTTIRPLAGREGAPHCGRSLSYARCCWYLTCCCVHDQHQADAAVRCSER